MPNMIDQKCAVSIVVPTYYEVENIPELIGQIDLVRVKNSLSLELLIMDDNSKDGTVDCIRSLNKPWVRLVVRTKNKGLSAAVVDGLRLAKNDILIVMDADLSHPPEKIPEMLKKIDEGYDFVIGSRFIKGGSTDVSWGVFRWLNSKVATVLARPFTSAKDPMSGFFALPRAVWDNADILDPIGYKIGLELMVKCHCKNIQEVPIHFADRKFGKSKLSLKEQLHYIQHIFSLFLYKY
jgi:dolichol-phosphate mannosyltransferase